VSHEEQLLGVDIVDQAVEPLDLGRGVGRIAEQSERDAAGGRLRRAAREQEK